MRLFLSVVVATSLKDKSWSFASPSWHRQRSLVVSNRRTNHGIRTSIKRDDVLLHTDSVNSISTTLRGGREKAGVDTFADHENPSILTTPSFRSTVFPRSTSYYLLWSTGFVKKFVLMSTILTGVHIVGWDSQVYNFLGRMGNTIPISTTFQTKFVRNVFLPLITSSCCMIQLAMNMFVSASGCAGFNTVLGPYRPFLLSILVFLNFVTNAGSIQSTLLRYFIAFMPEIVFVWNEYARKQWQKQRQDLTAKEARINLNQTIGTSLTSHSDHVLHATVYVDVPTMGCVSCINKIESNLRQRSTENMPHVRILNAQSWLKDDDSKGGTAKIELDIDKNTEDINHVVSETILKTIEQAGFPKPSITNVEILNVGNTTS